jgi:hypothetical protein
MPFGHLVKSGYFYTRILYAITCETERVKSILGVNVNFFTTFTGSKWGAKDTPASPFLMFADTPSLALFTHVSHPAMFTDTPSLALFTVASHPAMFADTPSLALFTVASRPAVFAYTPSLALFTPGSLFLMLTLVTFPPFSHFLQALPAHFIISSSTLHFSLEFMFTFRTLHLPCFTPLFFISF